MELQVSSTEFTAKLQGAVLWDYRRADGRISSLYEIAKQKSWNAASDIEWVRAVSHAEHPSDPERSPLRGFAPYEALTERQRIELGWLLHALELSEMLHGEQGALLISSQLVSLLPSLPCKLFASSQVFDEARHVEFFSRYLLEVVGRIHPPSRALRALIQQTVSDSDWVRKLVTMQIIIESLAMGKLQRLKADTRVPLLQVGLEYIEKDEARHVGFGVEYLKQHFAAMSSAELEAHAEYAVDTVFKLANQLNSISMIVELHGWSAAALRMHLRQARAANPQAAKDLLRQLRRNLGSIGLLTAQAQARLASRKLY